MRDIEIEDFFGPTTLVEIGKFESLVNAKLPESYKEFLSKYNGGLPVLDIFEINDKVSKSSVDLFYGITLEEKYKNYNLEYVLRSSLDIKKGYLPIGKDPGGNKICLCLLENNYGKVYFWDHENPSPKNLYLIAESFEEFLNKLH